MAACLRNFVKSKYPGTQILSGKRVNSRNEEPVPLAAGCVRYQKGKNYFNRFRLRITEYN